MASYTYPKILKEDYNAFQKIVTDLPDTFEEWEYEVQKKKNKDRYEHEVATPNSFESNEEIVRGTPFSAYCEKKRAKPTKWLIYEYAQSLSKS